MNKKNLLLIFAAILFSGSNLNAQLSDFITDLESPKALASHGNSLYILEPFKIFKVDITSPMPVATEVVEHVDNNVEIAIYGNYLYISSTTSGKIFKTDITSETPVITEFISGLVSPLGLFFNGNDLYVSEHGAGRVSKIDISAAIPTATTVVTGLDGPAGMELIGTDLYIVESRANKVSKIDITDAMPILETLITGLNKPLFLEFSGGNLFISERAGNKVSKINLLTNELIDFVTDLNTPGEIKIINNVMYITESRSDKISKLEVPSLSNNVFTPKSKIALHLDSVSGLIRVSGLTQKENYTIYNVAGAKLLKGTLEKEDKINVKQLPSGLYFLSFTDKNTLKFIVE